jgi:poly(A) polymerase
MDIQSAAKFIVTTLVQAGYVAYYAGGWVRDRLLGVPSADIDIATSASPEKVMELFPKTVPVGIEFGSVIVVIEGQPFEVTSFRSDENYSDGRRPEKIHLSSPEEDAKRRSLTINALFYDPLTDQVIDYVHGQEDLKKGIIRTVGDPYVRFEEDRLRMLRAIRFAARFNFTIEPKTFEAIKANAYRLFPAVAIERVWQEFNKMAAYPNFTGALLQMHQVGLLQEIFPSLKEVSYPEIEKRLLPFANFPPEAPTIAFLMELFPSTSLQEKLKICQRLKIPNKSMAFVELLHEVMTLVNAPQSDLVKWVHFYAQPESELCLAIISARFDGDKRSAFQRTHEEQRLRLRLHIERSRTQQPIVSARLLQEAGIIPGKKMGILLKEAERIAIQDNLENPSQIIERLKNSPLWLQHPHH